MRSLRKSPKPGTDNRSRTILLPNLLDQDLHLGMVAFLGRPEVGQFPLMWDTPMSAALTEAKMATEHDDVPIGAVLVDHAGEIVARAHNRREVDNDPTAHAELLVLRQRARELESWRLFNHTLVVTLEPCSMCAGAAINARVERIVYGASDDRAGAVWSLYNIPGDARLNHQCEIVAGVLERASARVLTDFFANRR